MTDYSKLVETLRYCASTKGMVNCDMTCKYGWEDSNGCKDILMADAADAIEALQAEIRESMQRCAECGDELAHQMPKRGEIVRCGECKYHLPETERTNPYCNRFHCMKPDDWFCADGEREVQE